MLAQYGSGPVHAALGFGVANWRVRGQHGPSGAGVVNGNEHLAGSDVLAGDEVTGIVDGPDGDPPGKRVDDLLLAAHTGPGGDDLANSFPI